MVVPPLGFEILLIAQQLAAAALPTLLLSNAGRFKLADEPAELLGLSLRREYHLALRAPLRRPTITAATLLVTSPRLKSIAA
jgi:hypothetical protein